MPGRSPRALGKKSEVRPPTTFFLKSFRSFPGIRGNQVQVSKILYGLRENRRCFISYNFSKVAPLLGEIMGFADVTDMGNIDF